MPLKHILGVIGALIPIVYCAGLLYHFVDTTGSIEDAQSIGLGPTLLGLAVVGLLFFIPLSVKLVRLFTARRSTDASGRPGANASKRDGKGESEGEFDADAVLARYMAKRSSEPGEAAGDGLAPRAKFGRKLAPPKA